MNEAKEKTALCTSVGADERQSVQNTISSISALDTEINHPDENSPENFEDIMRQMQRMSDPAGDRTAEAFDGKAFVAQLSTAPALQFRDVTPIGSDLRIRAVVEGRDPF